MIKSLVREQSFTPNLYIGWILNPSFIIRRLIYNGLVDIIKNNNISIQDKILDYGCGASPYRKLFNANKYIRMDIINESHSHLNEEIDIFFDGKKIPLEDDSIDFVLMTEVIEHLFEPDEVLSEIRRVLKAGGQLLVTAPFCWEEHEVPYDYARYTSFGLVALLKKNGFEIIQNIKTGNYPDVIGQMISTALYSLFSSKLPRRLIHLTIRPFIALFFFFLGRFTDRKNEDKKHYLNNILLSKVIK